MHLTKMGALMYLLPRLSMQAVTQQKSRLPAEQHLMLLGIQLMFSEPVRVPHTGNQ
jgi:hypothetical protein